VLNFDRKRGIIDVEAGIEWPGLIDGYLNLQTEDRQLWGIAQKQTGADRLVEVEDEGSGIAPEKREEMSSGGTPGVGIRGMRERMRQLGGDLVITSNGTGTIIPARLPADEAASNADALPVPDDSIAAA
jgi:sensor histidine kinase regulating citrate/malate metabolism